MTAHWYVLHCKPRKEAAAWRLLQARDFETFYPRLRVQPVNPRARKIRPYFPGYIFVRADLKKVGRSTLQWMPFTHGLVCFGDHAPPVPEQLITALRQHLQAINAAGGERLAQFESGAPVVIEDGPFEGYEAIFDTRLGGQDRVRVLLQLLNRRNIPVELRAGQIRPADR